jgi:hypothetical protein
MRAIFLYSRNGSNEYEPRTEHLSWFSVDWSAMDKVTYPKTEQCVIDDYTLVEDSQNAPVLVEAGKECVNHWTYGKQIYPSVELCADAVLANSTNCAAGDGYFFYSESEKLCRCCNAADARTNV